jgi:hypothetical protein
MIKFKIGLRQYLLLLGFMVCSLYSKAQRIDIDTLKAMSKVAEIKMNSDVFRSGSSFAVDEPYKKIVLPFSLHQILIYDFSGQKTDSIVIPELTGWYDIGITDDGNVLVRDSAEKCLWLYFVSKHTLKHIAFNKFEDWYVNLSKKYAAYFSDVVEPPVYSITPGYSDFREYTRFPYYYNLFKQNDTVYGVFNQFIQVLWTDSDSHAVYNWRNIIPCDIYLGEYLDYVDARTVLYSSHYIGDPGIVEFYMFDRKYPEKSTHIFLHHLMNYYIGKNDIYVMRYGKGAIDIVSIDKVQLVKFMREHFTNKEK